MLGVAYYNVFLLTFHDCKHIIVNKREISRDLRPESLIILSGCMGTKQIMMRPFLLLINDNCNITINNYPVNTALNQDFRAKRKVCAGCGVYHSISGSLFPEDFPAGEKPG
jgi:hypothetical protein